MVFFLTATSFFLTGASLGADLTSFLRVATSASTSSKENAIGVAFLLAASPSRVTDGFLVNGIELVDLLVAAFFTGVLLAAVLAAAFLAGVLLAGFLAVAFLAGVLLAGFLAAAFLAGVLLAGLTCQQDSG